MLIQKPVLFIYSSFMAFFSTAIRSKSNLLLLPSVVGLTPNRAHRINAGNHWTRSSPFSSYTTLPATSDTIPYVKIKTNQIPLSSGVTAEVKIATSKSGKNVYTKPPLVFIHGSFHSSWCWEKHYLPFFAHKGYGTTCAISLRGTGGTYAGDGVTKIHIDEHVDDITAFLKWLQGECSKDQPSPVLIAHSFGGLTVMKYLERLHRNDSDSMDPSLPQLSGLCVACSVPPSGNGPMTLRYLRRSPVASYKLTVGFAMKKAITNKSLCRDLFFGGTQDDNGISDEEIEVIQRNFAQDTTAMINLIELSKVLPSKLVDSTSGAVSFVEKLPPSMVIGASEDFVVDEQGVQETAQYFGVQPTWVDSPHDIMLGRRWQNGANAILEWLEREVCSQ